MLSQSQLSSSRPKAVLILLSVLFAVVVLRTAWINDDAYITFRTVDNLVHGYGPVWNVTERVQSYTHPLWMFLLAAGRLATGEMYYTALLLSLAVSLIAVLILTLGVARSATGAILGFLILVGSKSYVDFSTSGLENPLTHLLLALFFYVYFRKGFSHRNLFWLSLLVGLMAINRLDTLLLVAPALFYAIYRVRTLRALVLIGAGLLPFLAWEIFSIWYYGFPFPNTAYAKLNTGIPATTLIQQGLFYLLRSVDVDSLTVVTIISAVPLAFLIPQRRTRWLATGILFYLLYLVWIGGDFMVSRFLTAPLFCAVVVWVRAPLPGLHQVAAYGLFAAVVGLSLLNPTTSPLLSSFDYATTINDNQIEDVRGHHYRRTGLLLATAFNRLQDQGIIRGSGKTTTSLACEGMGAQEYYAGPHVMIVDRCALTDPLLARLPAIYTPDIYSGHYYRKLPDGYLATLQTGINQIADPQLAEYYAKLAYVVRGPLFDTGRLQEIWNLNIGAYQGLINGDAYRYPNRLQLTLADADRAAQMRRQAEGPGIPPIVTAEGAVIDLVQVTHAPYLAVGLANNYYELSFLHDGNELATQTISDHTISLGGEVFSLVSVPESATLAGYDTLRLQPLTPGTFELSYVELLDPDTWGAETSDATSLRQMLQIYLYTYLRADGDKRVETLANLESRILHAVDSAWEDLPLALKVDLLRFPVPTLQTAVRAYLPDDTVLVDENDRPTLRYLGYTVEPTTIEDSGPALRFHHYLEVLVRPQDDYSAWFHIIRPNDEAEWMIYDYFPQVGTEQWQEATVYEFVTDIELEPGAYDIAFGFWTPHFRERLYVQDSDAYWISLGVNELPAKHTD